MEQLTRTDFENLPETARVRVKYDSRFIAGFNQVFSQIRYPQVVKLNEEEWANLWDTYHDYEAKEVSFELVAD